MIVVITGVPGSGKTLWALVWLKAKAEKEGRDVYYSGIADLKLPWMEVDPTRWMDCPPNSLIVIDECQRVFRPRAHGNVVPDYVAALETHRHKGVDIVLITQHPMLIDSNVRRLCGLHFHVVRSWGRQKSTVHEWPTIKENCDKSRDDSVRHEFPYPKEAFGFYKSAEVHTHKARIPYHVWILCAVPFVVGYAGWRVYNHWFPSAKAPLPGAPLAVAAGAPSFTPGGAPRAAPLTRAEYIAGYVPRIYGFPHTAPAYDEVSKVKEAPYPAACVSGASGWCNCWSQQGTKLDTPLDVCRSVAKGGFYVPWVASAERSGAPSIVPVGTVAPSVGQHTAPVVGSLGTSRFGNFSPAETAKSSLGR